jgi:lambda family phage portal protein
MIAYKKQPIISRIKEAGRLIVGNQKAPSYKIKDLNNLVNYVVAKTRSERTMRSFNNEYTAAGEGRLRKDWDTRTDTPYTELNGKQISIVARSRDLYKNDSTYRGAVNTLIDNVVGTGLWPKPKVKGQDGKLNTALNKKLEYWFNIYSKPSQWDARKKFTYVGDGQRMILRTIIVSGDCFMNAVKNTNPSAVIPISWQMFEIDRLDNSRDSYYKTNFDFDNVKQTIHGININEFGEEVSYWIKGIENPVPKSRILHSYMADRPEQYIGLPAAVAALADIYDKHDLMEDYVLKSRAIAKVLWFLSNENDQIPYSGDEGSDGMEIEALTQMRGDKAPEPIKMPDSVSDTIQPLAKMLMHGITSGLGTSYTTVTRDMEGVNFAASKFIDIQEWRRYTALKDFLVYDHCNPFWENYIKFISLSGNIPEMNDSFYRKNPEMLNDVEWVGNGKSDVDPLKDVNADEKALRNGMTSLSSVLNKRGSDLDDQLDTIAEEREKIKSKGLVFDFMINKDQNTDTYEGKNTEIDEKITDINEKLAEMEGKING